MFGITEFASDFEGPEIRCVLKRLYSDFIVLEIPADGRALRPGIAPPQNETENGGKGTAAEGEGEEGEEQRKADEQMTRPQRLTEQQFERLKDVAEGRDAKGTVDIDLKEWTKEERKCLYAFIRATFGASALDTACVDGLLTVSRPGANGKKSSNKRWSTQWPKKRGDFLHFTMVKRNMDSQAAIHLIARNARLKPSTLALSGTKDRRAITAQRVSAFRVDAGRLQAAARSLRGIWLRDFCYADAPLRLGDASGNRFAVILRDLDEACCADAAQLGARIAQWARVGFLSYFGTQRFGTCGVDSAHIGRLLLSERWEAATAALLAPRAEANESLNACLRCYAGSSANAGAALKLLETSNASAGATVERALLSALASCPAGHKAAILSLHRDMRTMYIHAYQSLVFNRIVSRRRKVFGLAVLDGDLGADGEVLAPGSAAIERVCLPLPSLEGTKMPNNEVAQWYSEIASQDSIHSAQFAKLERQFALGSCYRPFLVRPANVQWELLTYSDDTEPLQRCEYVSAEEELKLTRRVHRTTTTEAAAKTECRQKNGADDVGMDRDDDDDDNHGGDNEGDEATAKSGATGHTEQRTVCGDGTAPPPTATTSTAGRTKRALRVSFDLPSGAYATVALRELMRTDFGKKAQKQLEEEMRRAKRKGAAGGEEEEEEERAKVPKCGEAAEECGEEEAFPGEKRE